MGRDNPRLLWLLAPSLVAAAALLISCRDSESLKQASLYATPVVDSEPQQSEPSVAIPGPYDVYVVKADGSESNLIRSLPGPPIWAWSPDGSHAAIVTYASGSPQLHIMSMPDAIEQATLALPAEPQIVWSPNGEWLALMYSISDAYDLEVARSDGSDSKQFDDAGSGITGWTSDGRLLTVRDDNKGRHQLLEFDPSTGKGNVLVDFSGRVTHAAISKDGRQAAVLTGSDTDNCSALRVIDLHDGSTVKIADSICGDAINSAWSPDDSKVAFAIQDAGNQSGQHGVYVFDLASGEVRKLSDSDSEFDTIEGWLPDESGVIVSRSYCGLGMECPPEAAGSWLVLIPANGGDERTLMDDRQSSLSPTNDMLAFEQDGLRLKPMPDGDSRVIIPADPDWQFRMLGWSADGQWFASLRSHSPAYRQFQVNADGTGLERLPNLANPPTIPWGKGELPSPDGSKTAVLGQPLVIKDTQTGANVASEGSNATNVSWSPDGRLLLFTDCDWSANSDVFLVDASGSGLRQLTHALGVECTPVFSPDEHSVAFTRYVKGDMDRSIDVQLVVLNLDTLTEAVLFETGVYNGIEEDWPAWSPDGKSLALGVRGHGLYVIATDGSGARKAADTDWYSRYQFASTRWLTSDRLYFISLEFNSVGSH